MKKYFFILIVLIIAGSVFFREIKEKIRADLAQPVAIAQLTPTPPYVKQQAGMVRESVFVPYWAVSEDVMEGDYDTYIYFGIVPGKDGIAVEETGVQRLDTFLSTVPEQKKKLLTLRMIESNSNLSVLKSERLQRELIVQTIALANEKGFDGVVLDLELSAIPFDSLVNQISNFTADFYSEAQKQKVSFALAVYGDSFYRLRPFDIATLAKYSDEFLVMSYDFHKARSNPGPNFPLRGKEIYGYDMHHMIDDFLRVTSAKKTTVVFGYFGYDWMVDENGNSLQQAKPLTYNQIQQMFLQGCALAKCVTKRDKDSSEIQVKYTDDEGNRHEVWFEDETSIAAKKKYLQERGINSFSYWAYSYY